jgi:predicted AlkP superfamily pyrophosphatase or phosphodiesterase
MKSKISLFIMVDACGWEIVKHDPFCQRIAPHRHKLESVFGYSSTCVPSIVSGHWPDEHRNWCYFVHDPENSPFRFLSWLKWLPKALTSRRIFRRWLTPVAKWWLGFKGYFDLYNIPFEHIDQFDFTEKKSPLQPKGMNQGDNIFDTLSERNVVHFVSDPNQSEEINRDNLMAQIAQGEITFGFMYWAGLDGLLHRVGNDSPEIPLKLRHYEQWIERLYHLALEHYEAVELHIFSDHGMANCDIHLDLKRQVEALPYKFGKDYAVVYDSTMARFWFFNEAARQGITALLTAVPQGRILPEAELKQLRAHFDDHQFGELIFLVREGVLIVPSHMGERPIRAMHGYHPHDPHSYATLLTNQTELSSEVTHIPHLHRLMLNAITPPTPSENPHVRSSHSLPVFH